MKFKNYFLFCFLWIIPLSIFFHNNFIKSEDDYDAFDLLQKNVGFCLIFTILNVFSYKNLCKKLNFSLKRTMKHIPLRQTNLMILER